MNIYKGMNKLRPDNSAKDNSADLKLRQLSQKYADSSARDNSANYSDHRSRANELRACQQRVGLYKNLEPVIAATLNREMSPIPIFFFRI